jgi:molybdopterin-guanine dinucleotide biosynthesis protein A
MNIANFAPSLTEQTAFTAAGLVLCGGQSRRMGIPKASLPIGSETMLSRTVRLLSLAVQPVVVVAAGDQRLPELPAEILVARDVQPGCGPLAGLQAGLIAISDRAQVAFVSGCDVPLLSPGFVWRMLELLGDNAIAVPVQGERCHPLAAVYRTTVLPEVTRLLNNSSRRMTDLVERVMTRRVAVEDLREVDPDLATLSNVNRPTDYLAVLRLLGFSPPREVVEALGV